MLKRHWIYFFFSLIFVVSCAPRITPPEVYSGKHITLADISAMHSDVRAIKATFSITLKQISQSMTGEGLVLLKEGVFHEPPLLHLKVYAFGNIILDVISRSGIVTTNPPMNIERYDELSNGIIYAFLWWRDIEGGSLKTDEDSFIISSKDRKIWLDRKTLLPLKQELLLGKERVNISYSKPRNNGKIWYPSLMKIADKKNEVYLDIRHIDFKPNINDKDFLFPS